MYGDVITIGETLMIALIAMIIVFLCLALIYAVLMVFKATSKKKTAVETIETASSDDEDETELMLVLATAIKAYEGK
jgi:Na+-transporting methylmalonyl-CoA/oxaloacetate decarboxylase gamma subunit